MGLMFLILGFSRRRPSSVCPSRVIMLTIVIAVMEQLMMCSCRRQPADGVRLHLTCRQMLEWLPRALVWLESSITVPIVVEQAKNLWSSFLLKIGPEARVTACHCVSPGSQVPLIRVHLEHLRGLRYIEKRVTACHCMSPGAVNLIFWTLPLDDICLILWSMQPGFTTACDSL